jgi:hypothetical protein
MGAILSKPANHVRVLTLSPLGTAKSKAIDGEAEIQLALCTVKRFLGREYHFRLGGIGATAPTFCGFALQARGIFNSIFVFVIKSVYQPV